MSAWGEVSPTGSLQYVSRGLGVPTYGNARGVNLGYANHPILVPALSVNVEIVEEMGAL